MDSRARLQAAFSYTDAVAPPRLTPLPESTLRLDGTWLFDELGGS